MKFTTALFRRTAVALSAIAALMVTGYATSQTVELRTGTTLTGSCAYSNMSVSPNGNVIVTCGASTAGAVFSLVAPSSLGTSFNTSNEVKVNRSGTSAADTDINYSTAGSGCAATTGTVTFLNGTTGGSQSIPVSTSATAPSSCTVTISAAAGVTISGGASKVISIVDPNANVTFSFASTGSAATVGSGANIITVNRSGGTNGDWTVPVTLGGTMAPTGTLPPANGTTTSTTLSFPAGTPSATITYTPPAVMPGVSQLLFTLGNPVPSPTAPVPGQTGTLVAPTLHTMSLSGPAVGCAVYSGQVKSMGVATQGNHISGPSGFVTVYSLPTSRTGIGLLGLYVNPYTPLPVGGVNPLTEVSISKCAGDLTDNADGCYLSSTGSIQINSSWANKFTSYIGTAARAKAVNRCMIDTTSTYYINIRVQYAPGACSPYASCGWDPVWKESSS